MKHIMIKWWMPAVVPAIGIWFLPGIARAADVATFEELTLAAKSYWNGSDGSGGFNTGGLYFNNDYNPTYGSWSGWAYSNMTDNTTSGVENQYSAITGSGVEGSSNYGVAYFGFFGGATPAITGIPGNDLQGAYFTNTTYAYFSMSEGDGFAKKFGGQSGHDPDWFLLEIIGTKADGSPAGTVEFYLADYRFDDNSQDYIVDDWTFVELTGPERLDQPARLEFQLSSSDNHDTWGMNTPAYFAMDNVILRSVPEPSLIWDGKGDGNWDSKSQWEGGESGNVPDIHTNTTVRANRVTLTQSGSASRLLINGGGRLAVGPGNTLEVAGSVEVAGATLEIAPAGRLNVNGDAFLEDDSVYVCKVDQTASGLIDVKGNVHLGSGRLTVQPVDVGEERGNTTRTIVTAAGGIIGTFDVTPVHDPEPGDTVFPGHLGLGVFHQGVNYNPTSVTVELFIAEGGDGNGDGKVDTVDITNLVANFGKPEDRTWTDNDTAGGRLGRGDGRVDVLDITDLVANFHRPDPGPTKQATVIANYNPITGQRTAIPEPGTVVMLVGGALATFCWWLRRRRLRLPRV